LKKKRKIAKTAIATIAKKKKNSYKLILTVSTKPATINFFFLIYIVLFAPQLGQTVKVWSMRPWQYLQGIMTTVRMTSLCTGAA
jgi:hypothetical protein